MNTNFSENSGLTVETSRAISSEISSQMSKKLEEIQANLNSQILDVINSAIEDKVLPSIKIAVKSQNSAKNANLDLRSDGLHPSNSSQAHTQKDLQSERLHSINVSHMAENTQNEFPRLTTAESNRINRRSENSGDSNQSDDDYGYDTDQPVFLRSPCDFSTPCFVTVLCVFMFYAAEFKGKSKVTLFAAASFLIAICVPIVILNYKRLMGVKQLIKELEGLKKGFDSSSSSDQG